MRTSEKRIPGKLVKRHTGRKLYFSVECYGAVTEDRAEEVSRTKSRTIF